MSGDTAQLLVATAGAVAGFAIAGPQGAQIGWTAGPAVGPVLFGPPAEPEPDTDAAPVAQHEPAAGRPL